jgi:glucose-6-phosphate isomerase
MSNAIENDYYLEESVSKVAAIEHILQEQALLLKNQPLFDLFMQDSFRAQNFSTQWHEFTLDYSKNFVTEKVLQHLIQLAHEKKLQQKIKAMFDGVRINTSENRAVLHTALRRPHEKPLVVEGEDMMVSVAKAQSICRQWVEKLNNGHKGVTGKQITDILHIGIGGSDLGPKFTVEALQPYKKSELNFHFVANIDPQAIDAVLPKLNPETTMVVVSSKSFTTEETLENAIVAKQWLQSMLPKNSDHHFIAVTANASKAVEFGVLVENILPFWSWVGGRYSIWSNIGFPLALCVGFDNYKLFLQGAYEMDQHFLNASWRHNLPVLMALIGHWYAQYWQAQTIAILPYDENLKRFPDYLQQLDMESNGKRLQSNNKPSYYRTGPVVWGQSGTNGQHAFYQLLHQGVHFIPCDFIAAIHSSSDRKTQHHKLLSNCLAQAQALMLGNTHETHNLKQNVIDGNRPSNMLLINKLTPKNLGSLIALYEHKVFTQGVLWGLNSFDQPGVELGKKLAKKLDRKVQGLESADGLDPSTQFLVQKIRERA